MTRTTSLAIRQRGYLLSTEFLLFVTILVIGLLVGWVVLRDSVNAELMDSANAIESSITYYYFNDPDRGTGDPFENDTLEFANPSFDESTTFPNRDSADVTPSTGTSANGNIAPFLGSESGLAGIAPTVDPEPEPSDPRDAFENSGQVPTFDGSEAGVEGYIPPVDDGAYPGPSSDAFSDYGSVEELDGSESGDGN